MHLNESDLLQFEQFVANKNELIESLNKSLEEIEAGDFKLHSEVKKKYEKWL